MRSIRTFLIVATVATMTLVTFVAAVQGYRSGLREAERLFDSQLQELARLAANLGPGSEDLGYPRHQVYQLWQNGMLRARTPNAPSSAIGSLESGFDYANFAGHRWRTLAQYHPEKDLTVVVAARTDVRFAMAEGMIIEAVTPIVLSMPVAALLIWLIVGYGLGPLRELAGRLRDKEPRDLGPVVLRDNPRELDPVLHSINGLLERLEASFEREKRFASDAAHELRTPLSALKVQLYNIERQLPRHSEEFRQLQDGVDRMGHLVEQILALDRSTLTQFNAALETVNLTDLAREAIVDGYPSIERKNQKIELTGETCRIRGDRFALETLLANLISNASKYTPAGGEIVLDTRPTAEGVILTVEDSGPGIPEEEKQRIFERFHRLSGDRHASGESGCGLGLAIVRNIANLHGAGVDVGRSRFTSGAAFRIIFPRQSDKED
jgi:two-component system sensor histidine kinase QseC